MECMSSGIIRVVFTGICLFLLLNPSASALDIFQQKNKNIMGWEDFQTLGDTAASYESMYYEAMVNGKNRGGINFEGDTDAVNYYTKAEQKLKEAYSGKPYDSSYYGNMRTLERKKARAYSSRSDYSSLKASGTWVMDYDKALLTKNSADDKEKAKIANENADNLDAQFTDKYNEEHKGSGCLIVTSTFGSPLASEVQLVRDYRDGTIRQSYTGSQFFTGFNAWYYTFSPMVADYIATHPVVKSIMQVCLIPLLTIILLSQNLHTVLAFSPELATVSVLLFGAAFYSLVYIFPPAFLTVWLAGRTGWKIPAPDTMRPVLILWILVFCGLAAGIVLSLDLITIVSSGLLVASTIILIAGTGSLALMGYLKDRSCIRQS
jgi:hypothetical protein